MASISTPNLNTNSAVEQDENSKDITGIDSKPRFASLAGLPIMAGIHVSDADQIYAMLTPYQRLMLRDIHDKRKDKLQMKEVSRLTRFHQNTPRGKTGAPIFDIFPQEVRDIIYKNFLWSPILGTKDSVSVGRLYGRWVQYELDTAFLRTSRRAREEGYNFLYGMNTFIIEGVGLGSSYSPESTLHICPLNRWRNQYEDIDEPPFFHMIPAIQYVKRWKLFVSAAPLYYAPTLALHDFCRSISQSQVISLEVVIIPRGVERIPVGLGGYYSLLEEVLKPLRHLRNVGKLEFRQATIDEIPDCFTVDKSIMAPHITPLLPSQELVMELNELVTKDSPMELVHEIYLPLLTYARCFERDIDFKTNMGDPYSKGRYRGYPSSPFNPFHKHTVEEGLEGARAAIQDNNVTLFKKHRAIVLNYLEEQYKRIVEAASSMVEYIKYEKREGKILDPMNEVGVFQIPTEDLANLSLVLEDYAGAFRRSTTKETEIQMRILGKKYTSRYAFMPRELNMAQISQAFDNGDFDNILEGFRCAVDDMDTQYLEMRAARKKIFEFDILNERGCSINVEDCTLSDERINWAVREPEIYPEEENHQLREYSDSPNSDDDDDGDGNDGDYSDHEDSSDRNSQLDDEHAPSGDSAGGDDSESGSAHDDDSHTWG